MYFLKRQFVCRKAKYYALYTVIPVKTGTCKAYIYVSCFLLFKEMLELFGFVFLRSAVFVALMCKYP